MIQAPLAAAGVRASLAGPPVGRLIMVWATRRMLDRITFVGEVDFALVAQRSSGKFCLGCARA